MAELLRELGRESLEAYWLPLALWSVLALLVCLILRAWKQSSIGYQYHGRASVLLALPVGLIASLFTSHIQEAMISAQSELTARFIVIQNPIPFPRETAEASVAGVSLWSDPNIWFGILAFLIVAGSLICLIRVFLQWNNLRRFARTLHTHSLTCHYRPDMKGFSSIRRVRLAFSDHIQIPCTFGWLRPVVVLPEYLREPGEKRDMAIRHELTHIRNGDFLLNGFLLIVRALFWFHPLVHLLQREVQEYREISCDREVISGGGVSRRKYVELLFELAPRQIFPIQLPVTMAVHPHLLKKRIEIMKSHEKISPAYRSSFVLTVVTALFVTGIMACTDLQRTDATGEELLGERLSLSNATITVNGVPYMEQASRVTVDGPANGIAALTLGKYGTFVLSGQKFEGAEPLGEINGNVIDLKVNQFHVVIRSDSRIISREEADLWVAHDAGFAMRSDTAGGEIHSYWASSYEQYREYRTEMIGSPPPPAAPLDMDASLDVDDDFFIAVEESPKLKGGIRALQAKLEYPEEARRAGIEGTVIVQFIINREGEAENPSVIRGLEKGLNEAAIEAVLQAQFEPGRQNGQAVRVRFSLPIQFSLSDGNATSSFVTDDRNPRLLTTGYGTTKKNDPPPPAEQNR